MAKEGKENMLEKDRLARVHIEKHDRILHTYMSYAYREQNRKY